MDVRSTWLCGSRINFLGCGWSPVTLGFSQNQNSETFFLRFSKRFCDCACGGVSQGFLVRFVNVGKVNLG